MSPGYVPLQRMNLHETPYTHAPRCGAHCPPPPWAVLLSLPARPASAALTLKARWPWPSATILGSRPAATEKDALAAQAVAAGSLPDPTVELGFANLPTDTYDFDQEAMTQFKVGIAQTFPGRYLRPQPAAPRRAGRAVPHQRDERRARLAVDVAVTWLEAYRASRSIGPIEQDRELFEHLVDVAESTTPGSGEHPPAGPGACPAELTQLGSPGGAAPAAGYRPGEVG